MGQLDKDITIYGQENYDWQLLNWSSVIDELFKHYQLEGIMSYTMADYMKEYRQNFIQDLSVEERLAGLSPDQRLQGLSPDEVLQHLSPDEIEAYLAKLKNQLLH